MGKFIDLTNEIIGRLTVIERVENIGKCTMWKCKCECGKEVVIRQPDLRSGRTQSCGCLHSEQLSLRNTTHNLSKTKLCSIWRSMKGRCLNPKDQAYKNYGGRGVTICEEWSNNFVAFYNWAINNGYSEELSIDRIDNNGNYEPSNCRWATRKVQANNKRDNHYLIYNGKSQTISQWANELNIKPHTILRRLNLGWSVERALSEGVVSV
ncbi:MAG: hypothetical protein IKK84_00250 [Clostridia bacterium]|nr:hypothetical protein [Clostridia bacterium]